MNPKTSKKGKQKVSAYDKRHMEYFMTSLTLYYLSVRSTRRLFVDELMFTFYVTCSYSQF